MFQVQFLDKFGHFWAKTGSKCSF